MITLINLAEWVSLTQAILLFSALVYVTVVVVVLKVFEYNRQDDELSNY